MDIAGLVKGAASGEGLGNALPSHLAASLPLLENEISGIVLKGDMVWRFLTFFLAPPISAGAPGPESSSV